MGCAFPTTSEPFRNVLAFWIFGLTYMFGYIISLGAADDILAVSTNDFKNKSSISNVNVTANETQSNPNYLICNPMGTGVILLAAVLPEILVKLFVQFAPWKISYCVTFAFHLITQSVGFVLLGVREAVWLRILGVVSTSIASGLGESTFVPLTSFYSKKTVMAWSLGSGTSGILGMLTYAGLTSLGVPIPTIMFSMLVVPLITLITYLILQRYSHREKNTNSEHTYIMTDKNKKKVELTFKQKFMAVKTVTKHFLSLCAVYFLTYFVNQGLSELLYLDHQPLSRFEQYRWLYVLNRLGIFLSRLPYLRLRVKTLWLFPLTMLIIITILIVQLLEHFIPYLWIIMCLLFSTGVCQGLSYTNILVDLTERVAHEVKEFGLGCLTLAGPVGIVLAGFVTVPFHNYICTLNIKM